MKDFDASTPVVVLNAKLAALGIMRSLGKKGVRVYAVDGTSRLPAMRSRYCAGRLIMDLASPDQEAVVRRLMEFAAGLGRKPVLFWTSDETAVLAAKFGDQLSQAYLMPRNSLEVVDQLQNKAGMHRLALQHGIPAPRTEFPRTEDDARRLAADMRFPIMLKAAVGSRLFARAEKKMQLTANMEHMLWCYREMEDPTDPNLMLQEGIPGGDDQVFIFNGYFDAQSECLNPYTGHKIRQYPVHVGCASLGVCRGNEVVSQHTRHFMKAIGYKGILDIGYRLDPRDGEYKVLDVNPRIGQAFRIFVGTRNEDVARDMYLDLTGQPLEPSKPREGRRWVIEDYDFISSNDYRLEGSLTFGEWLRSFRDVEECAWWWWKDPVPFAMTLGDFVRRQVPRRLRAVGRRVRAGLGRPAPVP